MWKDILPWTRYTRWCEERQSAPAVNHYLVLSPTTRIPVVNGDSSTVATPYNAYAGHASNHQRPVWLWWHSDDVTHRQRRSSHQAQRRARAWWVAQQNVARRHAKQQLCHDIAWTFLRRTVAFIPHLMPSNLQFFTSFTHCMLTAIYFVDRENV